MIIAPLLEQSHLETGFQFQGPAAFIDLLPKRDGIIAGRLSQGEQRGFARPEKRRLRQRMERIVFGELLKLLPGTGEILAAEIHFTQPHAKRHTARCLRPRRQK